MDILKNKLTVSQFIDLIGDEFPLLREFKNTEQDKDWHSEGNVHIHTDSVLHEAYKIVDAESLSDEKSIILILAALFHDYGKPLCTKEAVIRGVDRIASPNHEYVGASLLFFCNPPFDLSQQDWLSVVQLVAYHHIPKLLVVKDKPMSEYYKLSRQVKHLDLLYFLEIADMKGRTCIDKKEQIEKIDLFKMFAIEYDVFNNDPYSLNLEIINTRFPDIKNKRWLSEQMASRFEDGQNNLLEEELYKAYGYIDNQSHLIVLCGLSGSGKSHFTKLNYPDYNVISLDQIRGELGDVHNQSMNDKVLRIATERLKDLLRNNKNIIWDASNFRKDFRGRICKIGFAYKAFLEIVVIHTPIEKCIQQNKNRERNVPESVIYNQQQKFQLPDIDECHALTYF